jgi:hypothetical protein
MKEETLLRKDLTERSQPAYQVWLFCSPLPSPLPVLILRSPQPKINKTSAKIANKTRPQNVPIEEYLGYQGQIYQLKAKVSHSPQEPLLC